MSLRDWKRAELVDVLDGIGILRITEHTQAFFGNLRCRKIQPGKVDHKTSKELTEAPNTYH